MTREEIKKSLPILQAFAEGKTIQYKIEGVVGWFDTDEIDFKSKKISYRIKPESEPKYRPFRSVNECWYEMQKHKPFGWVKAKKSGSYSNIGGVVQQLNSKVVIKWMDDRTIGFDSSLMLNMYTFVDGTPFGVKEE